MLRNSAVNNGSRSWMRYRLPCSRPFSESVRLRPIWLTQHPSTLSAMPANLKTGILAAVIQAPHPCYQRNKDPQLISRSDRFLGRIAPPLLSLALYTDLCLRLDIVYESS